MADSLAVLATVEGRSQLDVFHDIAAVGSDVIRVRPANGKAGARAAEKPRAVYRGKPSNSVAEYLDSVRPLPGYAQGHSLTLHSPAPTGLERPGDSGDNFHASFPRLVAIKLAQELQRSSEVLESAVSNDTLDPFREAVDSGVSANLCESLAELAKQSAGVAIDLAWARVRPSNAPDSCFRFSSAAADILTEAAKFLRHREPSYDEQVAGMVVCLEKGIVGNSCYCIKPSRRQTKATDPASIAALLLYPFVCRISRFSFPRSRECRPSFQFTGPPLPARCRAGGSQD